MTEENASPSVTSPGPGEGASERVRFSKNLVSGLTLVAIALFALYASRDLAVGTFRAVGPGALPRALALLVLGGGLVFTFAALLRRGEPLGGWPLRGAFFICLALAAFALTIRSVGLAVAGPAVVIISGAASSETRPVELVIFALVLTAACIGLFRYALSLPIPVLVIPSFLTL